MTGSDSISGNCLFGALADQLFGDSGRHLDVRDAAITSMRSHKDRYIDFYGGAEKRRSKRKTAGPQSVVVDHGTLTDEARMADFERYLDNVAQPGVWGDHLEIAACARVFGVDVHVYSGSSTPEVVVGGEEGDNRQIVTIAYHSWRHYSSVRTVNEPHVGVRVNQSADDTVADPSPAAIPLPPSPNRSRASTPGSESIGREDNDDDADSTASRKKARRSPSPAPADKPKRSIKRAVSPRKGGMSRKPAPEASVPEEKAKSPVDCSSASSSAASPAQLSGSTDAPAPSGSTGASAAVAKSTTANTTKDAAAVVDSVYYESDISSVLSDSDSRRRLSQRASGTTTRGGSSTAKTTKKSGSESEWSESNDAKVTKRKGRVGGKGNGPNKTKGKQTKAKQAGPTAKASATPRSSVVKKGEGKVTAEAVAEVKEEKKEKGEEVVAKKVGRKGRKGRKQR